ncbi:MAG: PfkB family carbohydrate kinase [Patescibacteria group bacterium]
MLDLLAVGAIKLDTFIVLPEASVACELKTAECKLCIEYGKKIPVAGFATQIAGSAPNIAVALAKMNLKTSVSSFMGDDPVYYQAMAFLKQYKVSTNLVKKLKGFRSSAAVVLNFKGESTQLVDHVPHEYRLPASIPATKFIHISELGGGYEQLYRDAIKLVNKKAVRLSFNPGAIQIKEQKPAFFELLAVTEVLFLNMIEARQVAKTENGEEILAIMLKLKALGPHYVVVTDGQNGAYAFDGEQLDHVPMFPGKRVEATGAGDSFAAGFIGALLKKHDHAEALRWASVNAASVVGQVGPTAGLLTHTQIQAKLKAKKSFKAKQV